MTIEIEDTEPAPDGPWVRRKPPKVAYRVSAVPKRYGDQVQLSAVLRPYYGPLRADADIINVTAWTLFYWRRRAVQLSVAGCPPFAPLVPGGRQRLPNALNCPVAFVMTYERKKGLKPCCLRTICPFCWAREVRRQWLKIDAAFFPAVTAGKKRVRIVDTGHANSASFTRSVKDVEAGAKSPFDLVRRVFTYRLPALYKGWKATGLRAPESEYVRFDMSPIVAWLESRTKGWPDPKLHRLLECRQLLESAGPGSGLLESVNFRRTDDAAWPWLVEVRQLILAADGEKVIKALPPETVAPRHHLVIPKPRRRLVVSAVARTLHYPNWLINQETPVDQVAEYLRLRCGHQLVANFGRFRVKHTR